MNFLCQGFRKLSSDRQTYTRIELSKLKIMPFCGWSVTINIIMESSCSYCTGDRFIKCQFYCQDAHYVLSMSFEIDCSYRPFCVGSECIFVKFYASATVRMVLGGILF